MFQMLRDDDIFLRTLQKKFGIIHKFWSLESSLGLEVQVATSKFSPGLGLEVWALTTSLSFRLFGENFKTLFEMSKIPINFPDYLYFIK